MRAFLVAAALLVSGCASAAHDEPDYSRKWDDTVRATLVAYSWHADVDGDATAGGVTGSTDASQSQTVPGGRVEAYLDRVALVLDGFWLKVEGDDPALDADARYGRFDFSAAMRIHGPDPGPIAERPGPVFVTVDGIAGIRTHFAGLSAHPQGALPVDEDLLWIEPMAGARAGVTFLRRITVFGRADAAGIAYEGFQSSSWGAEVGVRVDLLAGLGAFAGTRWARIRSSEDSDDDGFDETEFDLTLDGVWAGIVWEF